MAEFKIKTNTELEWVCLTDGLLKNCSQCSDTIFFRGYQLRINTWLGEDRNIKVFESSFDSSFYLCDSCHDYNL